MVYYKNTIDATLSVIDKAVKHITTDDLRAYLTKYQKEKCSSKVTIVNIRRIHKVKTGKVIKETYSDEALFVSLRAPAERLKIGGVEVRLRGMGHQRIDTIMARITPCLENGKTSMVDILPKDTVGFGSTEFIVFRARPGNSDSKFVYYLACSNRIRDIAIKSMVGSSGRQRVQQSVVNNIVLTVPNLKEQKNCCI